LRVALLTNFIPPYRVSLFEALARAVDRLLILTSTEMESNRSSWSFAPGTLDVVVQKTLSFRQSQNGGGFRDHIDVHVPLDTAARLRGFAPDVIVTGELGARTIAATRFGSRNGVPVVVWATLSERTERRRGRVRRFVRERLLAAAEHVLVNGRSGERYVRSFGVSPERITRVPYTTAMEPFLALPLGGGAGARPLRVLFVGSLISRKAPLALLEAARAIADPTRRIELTFVGDGPLREELERRTPAATSGLTVRFTGGVDYAALPPLYRAADVLAFPTLADEWGLVVNEALAAGIPVLGSRESQAVEELVTDGENGWILEDSTPVGIACGLERVIDTPPAQRTKMKAAARASTAGLDPSDAARKIHGVLSTLVSARTR
jgi:glycosyltransferase involved in cell wall biosynthesis